MKYIVSSAIAASLMFGSAGAGTLLTVEKRSLDGSRPEVVVSTIAIDGKRVRIDHHEPNKSSRGSVIYRGDKKQMIVLDHRGNSFHIVTKDSLNAMNQQVDRQMSAMMKQMESKLSQLPPAQRQMVEQMMKQQNPSAFAQPTPQAPAAPEVKKTGVKKQIKGYPTEQYEVYQDGARVREMWVTDWASAGVKRDDFRIFKEMHQFQQQAFASMNRGQAFTGNDAAFDEFRQVEGLPLIVTSFEGNTKTQETTLQSLEKKDFDESYFTPPSDYKEARGIPAPMTPR